MERIKLKDNIVYDPDKPVYRILYDVNDFRIQRITNHTYHNGYVIITVNCTNYAKPEELYGSCENAKLAVVEWHLEESKREMGKAKAILSGETQLKVDQF